jgi:hypothetical protein
MDSAAGHARGIVDAAILAEGIKLERELNAANERIKRLEEAGDELMYDNDDMANINRWHKAKEAKP